MSHSPPAPGPSRTLTFTDLFLLKSWTSCCLQLRSLSPEEEELFFTRLLHIGYVRSAKPSQRFRLPPAKCLQSTPSIPGAAIHPAQAGLLPVYTPFVYSKYKILPVERAKRFGSPSAPVRGSITGLNAPNVYKSCLKAETEVFTSEIQAFIRDLFSTLISCSLCS